MTDEFLVSEREQMGPILLEGHIKHQVTFLLYDNGTQYDDGTQYENQFKDETNLKPFVTGTIKGSCKVMGK